ncbi:SNX13 isoform 7 [Pan troglodytes]|uniref:SNX13 isoform 7 n=2 Tax=Pan troglodytes TaxID=9598 RepID=A0A6D2XAA1_PANTR|nr:sorting nexin-13 isoform X6 [Pan paniscus]PNI57959.1 SNX13 isoform 7 [Pan troglodytes]
MLTEASLSIWGWGSLGIVLFLITFGPFVIFYLTFYILCFVGGGLVVTLLFGKTNSEKYLEQCEHSFLPPTSTGVPKCLEEMKREARTIKIDRRLTGANIIDEPLQQVIQFSLRDYVQYWYYTLSDDESFLLEIRQTLQNALVQFATRVLPCRPGWSTMAQSRLPATSASWNPVLFNKTLVSLCLLEYVI